MRISSIDGRIKGGLPKCEISGNVGIHTGMITRCLNMQKRAVQAYLVSMCKTGYSKLTVFVRIA